MIKAIAALEGIEPDECLSDLVMRDERARALVAFQSRGSERVEEPEVGKRKRAKKKTQEELDEIDAQKQRDINEYMKEVHKNLKESTGGAKYFCTIGPKEMWCTNCNAPFDVHRRIDIKKCPAGCDLKYVIERSEHKTKPGELVWLGLEEPGGQETPDPKMIEVAKPKIAEPVEKIIKTIKLGEIL